jgi:DNA replicative helicase MCM subunit Mcm2 (Cdc46/Mcm family)
MSDKIPETRDLPKNFQAIHYGFEQYLKNNFENMPISEDPLFDTSTVAPKKDIWNYLQIFEKERVALLDFQHMVTHLPNIVIDNQPIMDIFYQFFLSENVEEAIKLLNIAFNDWDFITGTYDVKIKPFEVRLFNFLEHKRLTEITYKLKNKMISITGTIVSSGREVLNFPLEKKWECAECGTIHVQEIKNYDKEPKEYKISCSALITDPNGKTPPFYCKNKFFIDRGVTKIQPVMIYKIESLQEETESQHEPAVMQIHLTDNLICEKFLNEMQENQSYDITCIPKLREIKKPDFTFYLLFLEVQSFKKIIMEDKVISVTEEEKLQIREMLAKPHSLEENAKMFGNRVVGFLKEKKAVLLMKLLQLKFNNSPNAKPRDYLLHMLLVGDYGRGKSEVVETFEDICDRPIYLTASSTTGVGLSGAVVKDDITGDYMIQQGAYSRASNDFLILEEFDKKQNRADLGILNEGMTKYQFTIAKANKYRKFKANTVVIMVANPIKKNFDLSESLLPQVNISGDLLSRFSFISAIIKPQDVEEEYRINEIMIKTMSEKLRDEDKKNAIFLKKCLKVACETNVNMDEGLVLQQLNNFTTLTYQISKKTETGDEQFWKTITPRHRKTLIIIIKAITMWHCHNFPTEEDIKEARELFFSFLRPFLEHPDLLNLAEIESGQTMKEIKDEIEIKMETMAWEVKKDDMLTTKKGKRELILDKITETCQISLNQLCDVTELQVWCESNLQINVMEFDKILGELIMMSALFEPKKGFVKAI